MKPAFALPLASALLAAMLAGCGQPGPLYLPNPPKRAPGAAPLPPPPTQAVPAEPSAPVSSSPAPVQQ